MGRIVRNQAYLERERERIRKIIIDHFGSRTFTSDEVTTLLGLEKGGAVNVLKKMRDDGLLSWVFHDNRNWYSLELKKEKYIRSRPRHLGDTEVPLGRYYL